MPSSRFVTKGEGGGGFPEISLDNLADEFFLARVEFEDDNNVAVLPRGEVSHRQLRFPVPVEKARGGASPCSTLGRQSPRGSVSARCWLLAERGAGVTAAENGGPTSRRLRSIGNDTPQWTSVPP